MGSTGIPREVLGVMGEHWEVLGVPTGRHPSRYWERWEHWVWCWGMSGGRAEPCPGGSQGWGGAVTSGSPRARGAEPPRGTQSPLTGLGEAGGVGSGEREVKVIVEVGREGERRGGPSGAAG